MNFWNLLFLGKQNFYHKTHWYEALFAKVVGAGRKLIAKFLKIKGNTIVWNQLNDNSEDSGDRNDVTFTRNTNGSWTISGTTTANNTFKNFNYPTLPITYIQDHIYLITGATSTCNIRLYGNGVTQKTFNSDAIFKADSSISGCYTRWQIYPNNSGVKVNETLFHMYFDLTVMFGQTKAEEILAMGQTDGVAYFRSLFPLPFYSYEQGKLLSFSGSGIKTTNRNVLDINKLSGATGITVTNGVATGNATSFYVATNGNVGWSNILFKPNTTYFIRAKFTVGNTTWMRVRVKYTDGTYGNGNQIATGTTGVSAWLSNSSKTIENIIFEYGSQGNNPITVEELCCYETSTSETEYIPYESITTSIPTSTYFPNGMLSAGSVYDELTPSKAIKRVGSVDLGSLEWSYYGTPQRFVAVVSDAVLSSTSALANAVCEKYNLVIWSSMINDTSVNNAYAMAKSGSSAYVTIRDTSYTSASDFTTAMNGVMLQFELAEEQVVNIDPPLELNYQVWNGGTEQLLPINTDNPVTSPILADIKYPDGERDDQYFTYRQYLPNSRIMSMALNTILGRSVSTEQTQEALDILMKGE